MISARMLEVLLEHGQCVNRRRTWGRRYWPNRNTVNALVRRGLFVIGDVNGDTVGILTPAGRTVYEAYELGKHRGYCQGVNDTHTLRRSREAQ